MDASSSAPTTSIADAPMAASLAQIAAARALGRTLSTRMPAALPLGVYQHYKNRELYQVEGLVRHTETEELMVLYSALYDTNASNPECARFARPFGMFCEHVTDARGQSVKRFQLLQTNEEEQALQAGTAATTGLASTTPVAEASAASSAPATAPAVSASSSSAPTSAVNATTSTAAVSAPTAATATTPAVVAPAPVVLPCSNPSCATPFSSTMMVCSRCHSAVVRYCGAGCQKADWKPCHQARCIPPSSLRLEAVRELIKKKDTLGYVEALRILAAMHATAAAAAAVSSSSASTAASSTALIPAEELAAATILEHSLRSEIRSKLFDIQCLYKHPCALFTGEEDEKTTWHRTVQQALEWMPARCRPSAIAAAAGHSGAFTTDKPLVVYFLGCRDSSEGQTDFRALGSQAVLGGVETLLVMIGPASTGKEEGLSPAPEQKFGSIRVRRIVGEYPTSASAASLPQPHLVVLFHSRVDVSFGSWSRAVDAVLSLDPAPALVVSGYSTDDSHLQTEDLLRVAMGAQVVLPTRRSAFGCAVFKPHVANSHITIAQGYAPGFRPATNPEERRAQINKAKTEMQARGFQLSDC